MWSDLFSSEHMPIDVIISPEIEVARAIERRLQLPGAFEVQPLANGKVSLVGLHCKEDTPIINTPLRQLTALFPDLHVVVIGISRDGRGFVPTPDDDMRAGDEVYVVADTRDRKRTMAAFGHEEERSEAQTSELQSLMRITYDVF